MSSTAMALAHRPLLARRYILYEPLGRGGMGTVYRAYDRLHGHEVALKRIVDEEAVELRGDSTDGQEFRAALAREFRLASTLRHPHIVQMLDYGFDEFREPYFTMELLHQPVTLLEACQNRSLDYRLTLFVQVLQALAYVHRRGIIHHDLKPANVLVVNGAVKLLDFGLAKLHERAQPEDASLTAGTLAYMAPEILMGAAGDATSDLYAAGMMAYEVFAGEHPFNVRHAPTLIQEIMTVVPDLDAIDVPSALGFVIWRLLAKDPNDRYASAVEVIHAINRAGIRQYPVESSATRESFLQASRMVSRDQELAYLTAALADAYRTTGRMLLVAGESGIGKSRLLDELRASAMVRGAVVMRGQGSSVAKRAYDLWLPVLRWLCLIAGDLTADEIGLLRHLISDLDRLLDLKPNAPPPSDLTPSQFLDGLSQFVVRVVQQSDVPVLILLDDLQWAGADSLRLLRRLRGSLTQLPLLIVGSYREGEAGNLRDLLLDADVLRLRRLDLPGIEALSEAMLGEAGRRSQVLELLQRESEGNVFFIIEVVRVLAEGVDQLDRIGLSTLPPSVFAGSVREVMMRRLRQLSATDRHTLQLAAVMGRRIHPTVLSWADAAYRGDDWLRACANATVLEMADQEWQFTHDKLREALLDSLTRDQRRTLHEQVALALEHAYGAHPDHARALAYHWGEAGHAGREAAYGLLAARQALRVGAYDDAMTMLTRCVELLLVTTSDAAQRAARHIELLQLTGEVWLARGDYAAARRTAEDMAVIAADADDARLRVLALRMGGIAALAMADLAAAHQAFERAMQQAAEGDVPLRVDLLNRLGDVYDEQGNQPAAMRCYQDAQRLRRTSSQPHTLADDDAPSSTPHSALALAQDAAALSPPEAARQLYRAAEQFAGAGHLLAAFRLLAFLAQRHETPDDLIDAVENAAYSVQPRLPDADARAAWNAGKDQSLEQLIANLRSDL